MRKEAHTTQLRKMTISEQWILRKQPSPNLKYHPCIFLENEENHEHLKSLYRFSGPRFEHGYQVYIEMSMKSTLFSCDHPFN
jgi:hypothetical protein